MQNTKVSPNIKPSGYLRSLGGYSLDFLFTFLLMVVIYVAFGNTAMPKITHYSDHLETYNNLVLASRLADVENGAVKDLSFESIGKEGDGYEYGYLAYSERVYHYYSVCVAQTDGSTDFSFLSTDEFNPVSADKTSIAYKTEVGKWIYDKVYQIKGNGEGKGDLYYAYPSTDDAYLSMPTLKTEVQANLENADTKQETAAKLLSFFRSSTSSETVYARTTLHFNSQQKVMDATRILALTQYLCLVPSIVIAPFVFYFLIPIISNNGLTLGKRIAKTAVIGSDGYKAKKPNIIAHYLIILLEWELLLIPNFAIGMMMWMFASLIGFMTLVMTKNHQSVHDKISRTIVISSRESIWFESAEAEASYAASNPSSLVAKTLAARNGETKEDHVPGGRVMVASDSQIALEDQILDLSTINKRREEARAMTSFDEFERGNLSLSSQEEPSESTEEEEEVELSEQEKADLAAIYGDLDEEDAENIEEQKKEDEAPINEDDFVDGK